MINNDTKIIQLSILGRTLTLYPNGEMSWYPPWEEGEDSIQNESLSYIYYQIIKNAPPFLMSCYKGKPILKIILEETPNFRKRLLDALEKNTLRIGRSPNEIGCSLDRNGRDAVKWLLRFSGYLINPYNPFEGMYFVDGTPITSEDEFYKLIEITDASSERNIDIGLFNMI